MNITIQINDDKTVAISKEGNSDSIPSATSASNDQDGGGPNVEGLTTAANTGSDPSMQDIGSPPEWLIQEIQAASANQATVADVSEPAGFDNENDAGTAPEF